MSYTRHKSATIAVDYSGSVSYPASEHGGTVSYSGTAYETVNIDIFVDTDPFDNSVGDCRRTVDVLTGAVVATNAAQCKSIHDNSRKVGKTIVDGFFKTIQSDLTQQIAQLNAGIEAQLVHMRELGKRCVAQQSQMATDYGRICKRYTKIFDELDTELENRIYALDRPSFGLKRTAEELEPGTGASGAVARVSIGGAESARLASQMEAGAVKRHALESIDKAHALLRRQRDDQQLLESALMPGDEGTIYEPVVYMEAASGPGASYALMAGEPYKDSNKGVLEADIKARDWSAPITAAEAEALRSFYLNEVEKNAQNGDSGRRIREYMIRLFDISKTKTLKQL